MSKSDSDNSHFIALHNSAPEIHIKYKIENRYRNYIQIENKILKYKYKFIVKIINK